MRAHEDEMSNDGFLKALSDAKNKFDFGYNKQPICPHCGNEYDIGRNDAWGLYQEDGHDVTCPACNRDFLVVTHVSHSFSTDEQDDLEEPT